MTQPELAEKIGVHETTIRRWEQEKDNGPDAKTVNALAAALNTTPEYLLTGDFVSGHGLGQQSIDSNSLVFRDKNREIILPNAPDTRALFKELVLQAMSGHEVAMA